MKKLLLLSICTIMLFGCKKDESTTINTESVELKYLETFQLKIEGGSKNVSWSSQDEFVATVDNNGKVTARHIGETYIIGLVKNKQIKYNIKVTPKHFFLIEPFCHFGASADSIKFLEKHLNDSLEKNGIDKLRRRIFTDSDTYLSYLFLHSSGNGKDDVNYLFNSFFGNGLTSASITKGGINLDLMLEFLNERYLFIEKIEEYDGSYSYIFEKGNLYIGMGERYYENNGSRKIGMLYQKKS